jgi:ATP-dependent Clp protease ATP-binding subunit ClpA
VELAAEARDWLAQEGYDAQFGARPLRRTLQRYVENPLSKRILAGDFHDGDTVLVEIGESPEGKQEPIFKVRAPEAIAVELPVQHQAENSK